MSISVSRGTPRPAARQRAITTYSKYRAATDFAVTRKEDNDTPVQSQSERDKTVAGNEGGSGRPSVGVKLPWCQFAADRLATSLRETQRPALASSPAKHVAHYIPPPAGRPVVSRNERHRSAEGGRERGGVSPAGRRCRACPLPRPRGPPRPGARSKARATCGS